MNNGDTLRMMPRVDDIVALVKGAPEAVKVAYPVLLATVREELDAIRAALTSGAKAAPPPKEEIALAALKKALLKSGYSLRPVINATGVVLHTNLGRAVLSAAAAEQVKLAAMEYSTLEYNVEAGERGVRHDHVETLLRQLTGAEAAMVVNNNAAAVLLTLTALCKDKEVVVSRGELVEIGGSFRIPEIMSLSGAVLREIGTTNKTKSVDYEKAVGENTGALLKVHTSNFKIVGFAEQVEAKEIHALAERYRLPFIYDLGSGLLAEGLSGLNDEPTVKSSIAAGADVVCFSGDKLLGGPQAGIIVGRKNYIEAMKKHQLARALRVDKLTLAALEATLRVYLGGKEAVKAIPTLSCLVAAPEQLKKRAKRLCGMLPAAKGFSARVCAVNSEVGGGSAPGVELPSYAVEITPVSVSAAELEKKLRDGAVPIICRIHKDKVLLDIRTVADGRFANITAALKNIFAEKDEGPNE